LTAVVFASGWVVCALGRGDELVHGAVGGMDYKVPHAGHHVHVYHQEDDEVDEIQNRFEVLVQSGPSNNLLEAEKSHDLKHPEERANSSEIGRVDLSSEGISQEGEGVDPE